jgi:hypothetical protein
MHRNLVFCVLLLLILFSQVIGSVSTSALFLPSVDEVAIFQPREINDYPSIVKIDYSRIPIQPQDFFLRFLPHIIPDPNVTGTTMKTFEFNDYILHENSGLSDFLWSTRHYRFSIPINNSVYYGSKKSPKEMMDFQGVPDQESTRLHYESFINDYNQSELFSEISKDARNYRKIYKFDDDEYLEFLARFVQSISYNDTGPTRFPIETIFEGNGDCEDKSFLLAGLLEREDYDVSLFVFESIGNNTPGHMMVGVKSNDFNYNGTNYALIETTSYRYVGQFQKGAYKPQPKIIKIGNGKKMYSRGNETFFINNKIHSCWEELNYEINKHESSRSELLIKNLENTCRFFDFSVSTEKSSFKWFKDENNPIVKMENDPSNYILHPENFCNNCSGTILIASPL